MRKLKAALVLLVVIMTVAVMPTNVFAVSGEGTENSPYVISSVSDLEFIRTNLSAHYKLGANISLSSSWTAIGTYDNPFTGSFDGNGHTVSGLKATVSGTDVFAGFFGYSTGDIRNLNVTMAAAGLNITATQSVYAGGIVGYNNGGELKNCVVSGTVTATVSSTSGIAEVYAGGIAGRSSGDILFSEATGSVTATVSGTSVGYTAANDAQVYAGGIAGFSNGELHNNWAMIDVTAETTATGKYMTPKAYAGGLAGRNTGNVTESHSVGTIIARATGEDMEATAYAGGLIGFETGDVTVSAASTDVTAKTTADAAKTYAGGLIGYTNGSVSKTYATGNVAAEGSTISDAVYAGGLVGLAYGGITSSYALGTAEATGTNALDGGLVGFAATAAADSYYKENNGYNTFAGCGISKSDEELKLQQTYQNWDFETTWRIQSGENGGYPYLIDISDVQAVFEDAEYVYDGTTKTLVATSVAENVEVTYANNTGKNAGVYKAVATLKADGYTVTHLTANLVIKPKVLTIKGLAVKNKEYDNTTKAEIDATNVVIEGVLPGDEVSIDAENSVANFTSKNVGDSRQVIISEIKFKGEDAENYTAGVYYAEANIFAGSYEHVQLEGKGTKEEPYIIYDEDELNAIRGNLDSHFELANNIVLTETWVPIGRLNAPFTGSLEGNNYTISGISVDQSINYAYSGLFGYSTGTISGLNVLINDNIFTTAQNVYIGAIAGYNGGTVSDCIVNGSVLTSPLSTYAFVGGIVGYNAGTVADCDSNVEINAKGSTLYAGGVAGENAYLIERTSSTGSVVVNDSLFAYAGGFVGINSATIKDCYSRGDVTINIADLAFMANAGGFAGRIESGNVSSCYSTGKPAVLIALRENLLIHDVGGFTSYNAGILTKCYYDKSVSQMTDADKGTPKTTAELKTKSTFENWDFDVWIIDETINDGYPFVEKKTQLKEHAILGYGNRTVTVSAYTDIVNATLIVASYSEGALVDIDFNETFTIDKGETLTYNVKSDFKEIVGGSVKVMFWKDFASAMPLCTYKEVKVR